MKLIKLLSSSLVVFLIAVFGVKAKEVNDYKEFKSCLINNKKCILKSNIYVADKVNIKNDVTIDLNGFNIILDNDAKNLFVIESGTVTLTNSLSNGKIMPLKQNENTAFLLKKKAKLKILSGKIEGFSYGVIVKNEATLEMNDGVIGSSVGIHGFENSKVLINKGTIYGLTGIHVSGGNLTINGGTIVSTLNDSNSGFSSAIYIDGNEKSKINVTINGGVIKGSYALYEKSKKTNLKINIYDGKFIGFKEPINVKNAYYFIKGGTFNDNVLSYKAKSSLIIYEYDYYKVGSEIYLDYKHALGNVFLSHNWAKKNEKVNIEVTPSEGYKLDKITIIDSNKKEIKVNNNSFIMPDNPVNIKVYFKKSYKDKVFINNYDLSNLTDEVLINLESNKDLEEKIYKNIDCKYKSDKYIVNLSFNRTSDKYLKYFKDMLNNITLVGIYNISLDVVNRYKNTLVKKITNLDNDIIVNFLIPKEMIYKDRTFYVYELRGKKLKIVNSKLNSKKRTLSFKTKGLGNFVIFYK